MFNYKKNLQETYKITNYSLKYIESIEAYSISELNELNTQVKDLVKSERENIQKRSQKRSDKEIKEGEDLDYFIQDLESQKKSFDEEFNSKYQLITN